MKPIQWNELDIYYHMMPGLTGTSPIYLLHNITCMQMGYVCGDSRFATPFEITISTYMRPLLVFLMVIVVVFQMFFVGRLEFCVISAI